MGGSNFEEGLSRSRGKETNNQQDAGAKSGTKVQIKKLSRETRSNPRSGGGINRSTAGKP